MSTAPVGASARARPVDAPVARDGGDPAVALLARREPEPADRALAALVVAVEDLDCERLPLLDRAPRVVELRRRRVAERALPEADVTGRDVDVARQPCELLERRVVADAHHRLG